MVGKVKHTGLVEVPMGTTLRTLIYDIGGGIIKDRPFKAIQTGGRRAAAFPRACSICRSTSTRSSNMAP